MGNSNSGRPPSKTLTQREAVYMAEVAEGLTDKEIARKLGVSPSTVHCAIIRAYKRFGARNRAHAAVLFVRGNL